ncbi:hypothetical protein [uncultured Ruthenibacterium sp.]|uniref:hypothetical protein n=1 Tax=uncultured Ruthenibacterium sp. TaxID=1905347 RepID=UPI00349EFCF5
MVGAEHPAGHARQLHVQIDGHLLHQLLAQIVAAPAHDGRAVHKKGPAARGHQQADDAVQRQELVH